MKKFLLIFALTFVLVGCSFGMMENTPTQKVEDYLSKYQRLDKSVMDDLDVTLQAEDTLDDDEREDYKEFMKKHYQDL
ncbi:MAG: hypothetical protein IJ093_03845, partial [Bacilli bacterium]|nr:hypothetical protein [Bacilli bacterium]